MGQKQVTAPQFCLRPSLRVVSWNQHFLASLFALKKFLPKELIQEILQAVYRQPKPLFKTSYRLKKSPFSPETAQQAGVAISPFNGDIAVVGSSEVSIFCSKTGQLKAKTTEKLNYPMNLAISLNGDIYVADYSNSRIVVFSADGSLLRTFGELGSILGAQFNSPWSVILDEDRQRILVADSSNRRIQIFDFSWEFKSSFSLPQEERWKPVGLGLLADGRIVTSCNESSYCHIFSPKGELLQRFSHDRKNSLYQFLVVDGADNIAVADWSKRRIVIFSSDGKVINKFDVGNVYPRGLALCPDGELLVHGGNVVQCWG